jgi:hypothetical protein
MGLLQEQQAVPVSPQGVPPTPQPMPQQDAAQELPAESLAPETTELDGEYERLKAIAIDFMYGKKFTKLIKMFKDAGTKGFARAVAVAVNGAIAAVKQQADIDHRMAAVLGMDLFLKVVENMATGAENGKLIVPGLEIEQIQEGLVETIRMYAKANPDITEQDMQLLYAEIKKQGGNAHGTA